MRLDVRGVYPPDWSEIARRVKAAAGWRCVRCGHPFDEHGQPLACDDRCDPKRGRTIAPENVGLIPMLGNRGNPPHYWGVSGLNYGVHHLDGDKANCRWWNLLPTCNSCHLTVQAKVIPDRPYLWEHSRWFVPYVCGFYAWYHGHEEITRAEAYARPDYWLALGQPWREATV